MREKIMGVQQQPKFGTISEFSGDRHLDNNQEQAEAYVHELAGFIGQIVFSAASQFSVDALLSFPRFPGGAGCDARACVFWMVALLQWINRLTPEEAWALATAEFTSS
jgi:hypothetical protein